MTFLFAAMELLLLVALVLGSGNFPGSTGLCTSSGPLVGFTADLSMIQHQLRGTVLILDDCTFQVSLELHTSFSTAAQKQHFNQVFSYLKAETSSLLQCLREIIVNLVVTALVLLQRMAIQTLMPIPYKCFCLMAVYC